MKLLSLLLILLVVTVFDIFDVSGQGPDVYPYGFLVPVPYPILVPPPEQGQPRQGRLNAFLALGGGIGAIIALLFMLQFTQRVVIPVIDGITGNGPSSPPAMSGPPTAGGGGK